MQIRPVSELSGLALSPHSTRLCSCSACVALASPLPRPRPPAERTAQSNADGDTYTPGRRLSREDEAKVRELEARDAEVRAHENAHKAAAGGLARGGPNYEYTTGPDGKRYAVGGDVQIDTSPGRTPEETIAKAQRIRAAGLAPAQPSAQDQAVVAQATRMEAEAQREKAEQARAGEDGQPRLDVTA